MILWSTNTNVSGLDLIVSKLKQHPLCYHPDHKFYTSYYTHPKERPEKKLDSFYKKIISDACKDLTLFDRGNFQNYYWMQLYPQNGGTISLHHHHAPNAIFSWVHFIKPSSKKCFYFLNHKGDRTYPEQNEGDFIIFPSWAAHSVEPNQDKDDRIVTAGNVFAESIEQEFQKGFK